MASVVTGLVFVLSTFIFVEHRGHVVDSGRKVSAWETGNRFPGSRFSRRFPIISLVHIQFFLARGAQKGSQSSRHQFRSSLA